jgi:arylsulfatase A-like enzyme
MSYPIARWTRQLVAILGMAVFVSSLAVNAQPRKPNIIVFLADDLGYGELSCQGYTKEVPTPQVDSIAKNGIRFTQGCIAATYCSPSRAGLMTGRYPTRFGHEFNGNGPKFGLPLTETTLADRLKALGYATAAVGKWHLGDQPNLYPTKRGFDEFMGSLANPGSYYEPRLWVDSLNRVTPGPGFYTTEAFADRALDWIERNKTRPFFLYLPFNAEHAPLHATEKYLARFPDIKEEKRRTFAAMLSAMDDAIGRVLAKVREIGAENDTLIVFFSDNGGPTPSTTSSNGPLHGFKATTSEGGTRIAFMMQWKGRLPAGKIYEQPVIQLDLLPTFVVAAGGTIDPSWKLDGVDLMPYLTGKNPGRPHQTLYWRFGEQWAIRDGDWKLVASRVDNNQPRLINLAEDIGEAKDLSSAQPQKLAELTAKWKAWSAEQMAPQWGSGSEGKAGAQKKKNKKKVSDDDDN